MDRKHVVLGFLFIAILTTSLCPPPLEAKAQGQPLCWFKTFNKYIHVIATFQDGIYVAGNEYLAKLDSDATLHWFVEFDMDWGYPEIESIAVSQNGIYITGEIEDDYYTSFLAKFDFSGDLQWFKVIQKADVDIEAYSIAVAQDELGRDVIYVAGEYSNEFDKRFVAKFDGNGNFYWFKCTTAPIYSPQVVTGNDGIYVAGNEYLAKLDSDGNVQWFKAMNVDGLRNAAVAQDELGRDVIYVAGEWGAPCLAKFDTNGDLKWFRRLELYSWYCYVAATQDGVYLTGPFQISTYDVDVFVAKFDTEGSLKAFKLFGGPDHQFSHHIAALQDSVVTVGDAGCAYGWTFFVAKLDLTFTGDLYWTGGENWSPITVRDYQPTVSQPTLTVTSGALSLSDEEVTVTEEQVTVNQFEPTQHLAVSGQLPQADFTWSPEVGIVGQPIQFDASASYDPDGQIAQYQWDFGDGTQLSTDQPIVQHAFQSSGTYSVTLTVIDDFGLRGSVTKQVTVTRPPVADFTWSPESPLVGEVVQFTASAYDPDFDGWIVQVQWDFGDGTSAYDMYVQHTFTAPGTYQVTFTVTDNLGATTVVTHYVTVQAPINPFMLTVGTRRPETLAGLAFLAGSDSEPKVYLLGLTGRRIPYLVAFDSSGMLFSETFSVYRRAEVDGLHALGDAVYATGHYRKAFIAKFNEDGRPARLVELGTGRLVTRVNDLAANSLNVYAVGQWEGTSRETRGKAFLAKVVGDQVEWAKAIDARRGGTAKAVWLSEAWIYVVGTTYSEGRGDVFVAKFSYDGNLQSYATFGGRRAEAVKDAVYYDGYLYIVGDTRSFGRDKVFVAKFNPEDMQVERFTILDLSWRESSFSIAQGSIYIAGSMNRDRQGFLVELSPDTLEVVRAKALTGPRRMSIRDMVCLPDGILLAGQTSVGEGSYDAFLALLPYDFEGLLVWPEGWRVSVESFELEQDFVELQAEQSMPRVYDLQGFSARDFSVQPWPAAVHQSITEE